MNRTKKFFFNTVSTAFLQIISMISGFILPGIMLSVYGSEINGLVSSITQFISILSLVEAGLSGATVYSLYKPLANEDHTAINKVVTAARNFYYKTGFIFLGLILTCALAYPFFIKTQLLSKPEISILFVVLGASGILEFFTLAKYRALLTADQKTYVISLASIVQIVVNCAVIALLSYTGMSIVIVRAVAIISILLRTGILWLYCRMHYKFLDFSVEPNNKALDKRWDALYFQIVGVIHTGFPVIAATLMLTLNEVSIYSIYHMVIAGVNGVLSIFTSGLSAGFGDLLARKDDGKFKKAFQQFEFIYYALITAVYATMMITYIPFIKIYTDGADINYVYPLFAALISINGYLYNLKTPYGMLTLSAGKYKESRVQVTTQALLEVVFSLVLARLIGLNGIIIGSIISNLYRDIDFIFFAPKHLIKYSFRTSLMTWLRNFVLFAIVCLIGFLIPTAFVTNYAMWFLYAAGIGIMAVVVVFGINALSDRKKAVECLGRIKSMVKNK